MNRDGTIMKSKNLFCLVWVLLIVVGGCKKEPPVKPEVLLEAVEDGGLERVQSLIASGAGADVHIKNNSGRTALHFTAWGHRELAELLLDHGANVNVKDKNGRTPLHDAVFRGCKDLVELLLAKGADVKAVDKSGFTPLAVARRHGHQDVAELLSKLSSGG